MNRPRTIIYDGCCLLCATLVENVARHDRRALFRFVPAQSASGAALQEQLGIDALASNTLILIKAGQAFTRSDALLEIARDLDGPWKLGRVFRILPRSLRDTLYGTLADNRYRWPGGRALCGVDGRRNRKDLTAQTLK